MPSIHVKDDLYGRYVKVTGKMDFKDFVNETVEEKIKEIEGKEE